MEDINCRIFVDESCHLENDQKKVMCVGQIKVANQYYENYKAELSQIMLDYFHPFELKWTKVSSNKLELYKKIIDFFFDKPKLDFRAVLIKYKDKLDHTQFNQGNHDNFYYKMIYYLLYNPYVNDYSNSKIAVFLDIKDTRGRDKIKKLSEVFENKFQQNSPFVHLQHIRSHESLFIQLADFFIGAIAYKAQGLHNEEDASEAKKEIIDYIERKSGYDITEGTEPWETKFNIFDHQPRLMK